MRFSFLVYFQHISDNFQVFFIGEQELFDYQLGGLMLMVRVWIYGDYGSIYYYIQFKFHKMQWQFRKVLENLQNYRVNSQSFISQIEKGTHGVLLAIVREMEHIISNPEQKIIAKVLAMRFAKDIMILGRQDVVTALIKIVPHMLKICSFRLEDDNFDKGETFFNDHPAYKKGNQKQKKQIERYASTYFILTLESIYHWAKWIPTDENGQESIYLKGYNSLRERGVKFDKNFNYYKQSDTQRFKNVYRVQFFTESSFIARSVSESLMTSRIEEEPDSISKVQQCITVQQIKNTLNAFSSDPKEHLKTLQEINKKLQTILEVKYSSENKKYKKSQREEKNWIQKYIINYSLVSNHKIPYKQFLSRMNTEVIDLSIQEEVLPEEQLDKKWKKSAKKELITKDKQIFQQLLHKQEEQIKKKTQSIAKQKKLFQKQLQKQKKQAEQEKQYIINEYESRIKLIKKGLTEDSGEKTQYLIQENQKLKEKLYQIQRSFKENQREKELQSQRNKLLRQIQVLKIQNQKLKAMMHQQNKTKQLEQEMHSQQTNKHFGRLNEEVSIYKSELNAERQKYNKRNAKNQKKILQLQFENNELKQQVSVLKKKLDLKDMQSGQLSQQVRLYKAFDKQGFLKVKEEKTNQQRTFKYKKFQQLRNNYKASKELFIRFCRCAMKKKDIIYKENQLEIGLITEVISEEQVKFIVHFTNLSSTQFENIQVSIDRPSHIQTELSTAFIFCIQRQQQQKVTIRCKSNEFLSDSYHPVSLSITYGKNQEINTCSVNLPFLGLKSLEFYKPDGKNISKMATEKKESIGVYYSKKMLSQMKNIKMYFGSLEETSSTIYECQALHRTQNFMMRICFQFTGENFVIIEIIPIKEDSTLSQKQQQILYDLISFMEFAFKK